MESPFQKKSRYQIEVRREWGGRMGGLGLISYIVFIPAIMILGKVTWIRQGISLQVIMNLGISEHFSARDWCFTTEKKVIMLKWAIFFPIKKVIYNIYDFSSSIIKKIRSGALYDTMLDLGYQERKFFLGGVLFLAPLEALILRGKSKIY